jgi:hypothetical protein
MPNPIRFTPTGPAGFLTAAGAPLTTAELISGQPVGLDHAWYEEGAVKAGIWRSCGYTEFYESYPCDEFMVILEGEVTVENESFSATYKAGDSFLIPKGFRGFWRQPGDMLKYYMIVS